MEKESFIENIVNSPPTKKLQGKALEFQKKDQRLEEIKSLNIGQDNYEKDIDSGQDHFGHKMSKSGVKEAKDQGEKLDTKGQYENFGKMDDSRNSRSEAVEPDGLYKMDESRDLESKARGEKLNDDICMMDESGDLDCKVVKCGGLGKMDESRDLDSKAQGEKLGDNMGKMEESRDLDFRAQQEKLHDNKGKIDESGDSKPNVTECDVLWKMDGSRDLEFKAQEEKLDDKLGKIDECRDSETRVFECSDLSRMDGGRHLGSKAQGEKSVDNTGKMNESRDSKSNVFEFDDLGKMDTKARGEKGHDNTGKRDESRDSNSRLVECDELIMMDESRDLELKARGERLDDNMGKIDKSLDLESKAQVEKLDDNLYKMDNSRNLESKALEEKLNDNMAKMDESKDLEFRARGEKLDDDMGKMDESRDLEYKVVEYDDMGKMDESRDLESKVVEYDDMGKVNESTDIESEVQGGKLVNVNEQVNSGDKMNKVSDLGRKVQVETNRNTEEINSEEEKKPEPVFDGTEDPGMEANRSTSACSAHHDPEVDGSSLQEKAFGLKNFVREKGAVVTNVLRLLSRNKDETGRDDPFNERKEVPNFSKDGVLSKQGSSKDSVLSKKDSSIDSEVAEVSQKAVERSPWNPLNFIKMSSDVDGESKSEQRGEVSKEPQQPLVMKGRVVLYTRLGCQDCREVRSFLQQKRLRYVEINIDVYPGRKLELEKISGSSAVPKVFFNKTLIGGLSELKGLEKSGKFDEKIDFLINEAPSFDAPMPPLSGEDDMSTSGAIDELALIVLKMKDSLVVKDRFYKMRRFTCCFTGSEAVNFLSEDQYLEREEAIEFGRKLATKLFFQHVLDENVFEDGNHLYRFLDHDPIVSQCQNIPRGIIDAKPKPISEIASRLRYLCYAIFEAYVSVDGMHVDYRSIHGSEEFARYLRTVQELQRVELQNISREEKLAFFINIYNMMAIHAILLWGHPTGALERKRMFGEFTYVIGGCTYSLSAIQNGVLRANQRPPYNLLKPFGAKDKRSQVSLPYPEPLIHFALVYGTRSGPALRCYSPGNVDQELMEAARNFLRGGGLTVDLQTRVASINKILKWFSVDFGKNEAEVLKHASNYLEPTYTEPLLELLANFQLKVIYQPYDWGLNGL